MPQSYFEQIRLPAWPASLIKIVVNNCRTSLDADFRGVPGSRSGSYAPKLRLLAVARRLEAAERRRPAGRTLAKRMAGRRPFRAAGITVMSRAWSSLTSPGRERRLHAPDFLQFAAGRAGGIVTQFSVKVTEPAS
jgi:hypothetical protein